MRKRLLFALAALALAVPASASARDIQPANDDGGGSYTDLCVNGQRLWYANGSWHVGGPCA